jgi:hypothetical protein
VFQDKAAKPSGSAPPPVLEGKAPTAGQSALPPALEDKAAKISEPSLPPVLQDKAAKPSESAPSPAIEDKAPKTTKTHKAKTSVVRETSKPVASLDSTQKAEKAKSTRTRESHDRIVQKPRQERTQQQPTELVPVPVLKRELLVSTPLRERRPESTKEFARDPIIQELKTCANESFLTKTVCENLVRSKYCPGKWGQIPECPNSQNPDSVKR